MLLVVGHKTGTVHHEVAFKVDTRQHILQLEILLIGTELGEVVFLWLRLGRQCLIHHTLDGGFEVVGVDEGDRIGSELGELHHSGVDVEVGIAGVLGHAAAFPRQAAALTLEGVGQEIIGTRSAIDGRFVGVVACARRIGQVNRAGKDRLDVVADGDKREHRIGLCAPYRRARLIECAVRHHHGGIFNKLLLLLLLVGDGKDGRHRSNPLVEYRCRHLGTSVCHQSLRQVDIVGHRLQFGLAGSVVHIHHLLLALAVKRGVNPLELLHHLRVGSQFLLGFYIAVEV